MAPLNFDSDKDLRPYTEKLRGVTFECLHWVELLDRYVMQQKRIQCLVVCDPPYLAATKNAHYRYRFDEVDHLLLARKLTLINDRNGGERSVKIMLTYDDDENSFVRALYRPDFGWHIRPLSIRYAGGHHGHNTEELLITNYQGGE